MIDYRTITLNFFTESNRKSDILRRLKRLSWIVAPKTHIDDQVFLEVITHIDLKLARKHPQTPDIQYKFLGEVETRHKLNLTKQNVREITKNKTQLNECNHPGDDDDGCTLNFSLNGKKKCYFCLVPCWSEFHYIVNKIDLHFPSLLCWRRRLVVLHCGWWLIRLQCLL